MSNMDKYYTQVFYMTAIIDPLPILSWSLLVKEDPAVIDPIVHTNMFVGHITCVLLDLAPGSLKGVISERLDWL